MFPLLDRNNDVNPVTPTKREGTVPEKLQLDSTSVCSELRPWKELGIPTNRLLLSVSEVTNGNPSYDVGSDPDSRFPARFSVHRALTPTTDDTMLPLSAFKLKSSDVRPATPTSKDDGTVPDSPQLDAANDLRPGTPDSTDGTLPLINAFPAKDTLTRPGTPNTAVGNGPDS